MKSAVTIFHKNIDNYPRNWIDKCYYTIRNQQNVNFDVFEIDYGGGGKQTYEGSTFFSQDLGSHANAHNFLLDRVFEKDYDCAFNVNVDDWYALDRFEKQIPWIEKGYDVVSSNFCRSNRMYLFHDRDIIKEADRGHNIIAHPVLCYSRNFWTTCNDRLNPAEVPFDDFNLWKRCYQKATYKFVILPDLLLYHRVHESNVSKKK